MISPYTVYPLVFRAGTVPAVIHIHAKYGQNRKLFEQVTDVRVFCTYSPVDNINGPEFFWEDSATFELDANGDLVITTSALKTEDEYTILLQQKTGKEGKWYEAFRDLTSFKIYALKEDLFALRPFRGDFHMHSTRSDGKDAPEYVAASCRRIGDDFMALTDHGKYEPSLEVIEKMKVYDLDMKCYPGEEVHLPGNEPHIIHFGGRFSVNGFVREHKEQFDAEVEERKKEFASVPSPVTRLQMAISEWAYDKIREAGGVCSFCHPYWGGTHNSIGEDLIDLMLARKKFDALEVFGGFYKYQLESNMLALMRYQQELGRGNDMPVVGVSDAHGCDGDLFGWYYTVVFAPDAEFASLKSGILENRCVAVQAVPDSFPIVAGPFRLVKYAYFLLREYFPAHNELCRIEGELVLRHLSGEDDGALQMLRARKGSVAALMKKLWGE